MHQTSPEVFLLARPSIDVEGMRAYLHDVGGESWLQRRLEDEGTSYHYLPPADFAEADERLVEAAMQAFADIALPVYQGASWTTDAPFRETAESIASRRRAGILAVEMEAASLYAFAAACKRPVICLAHVSNQLGCVDGDFEKGDGNGAPPAKEPCARGRHPREH